MSGQLFLNTELKDDIPPQSSPQGINSPLSHSLKQFGHSSVSGTVTEKSGQNFIDEPADVSELGLFEAADVSDELCPNDEPSKAELIELAISELG